MGKGCVACLSTYSSRVLFREQRTVGSAESHDRNGIALLEEQGLFVYQNKSKCSTP